MPQHVTTQVAPLGEAALGPPQKVKRDKEVELLELDETVALDEGIPLPNKREGKGRKGVRSGE